MRILNKILVLNIISVGVFAASATSGSTSSDYTYADMPHGALAACAAPAPADACNYPEESASVAASAVTHDMPLSKKWEKFMDGSVSDAEKVTLLSSLVGKPVSSEILHTLIPYFSMLAYFGEDMEKSKPGAMERYNAEFAKLQTALDASSAAGTAAAASSTEAHGSY